jgi:hypothetical protein
MFYMKIEGIKSDETSILKTVMFASFVVLITLMVSSCNKATESSHLSIHMTDAIANYSAVMVDIQGVEVIVNDGAPVLLNTETGIYNLLDYSNGLNTLLATGDLKEGTISQIRLILGTNNTVTHNNVVYPLSTPSAMQSGLKLQIHQTLVAGVSYSILLDFDAHQSIILKGNGDYQLKPVIRTIEAIMTGSIRGSITPIGVIALVTATSNGVNFSSVTNANGDFLIDGIPVGTYDVTVTPDLPLLSVTVTGIKVTLGASTNLGTLAL